MTSVLAFASAVAGESTDVKATPPKAEQSGRAKPPKLEPVKAGPVYSSLESREVSRAKIYPSVANFSSRYTQTVDLPMDPPSGLKIGNTTLFPTWNESVSYEDNLYGASRKKTADVSVYTQPGFGVMHRFNESIQMACYYKFGWNDYLDDNAKDYLTHNVDFSLNMTNIGVEGFSINVFDTYAQTGNPGELNDNYDAFVRQHQNSSGAMFSYERERITASASYDYTIVDEFRRDGYDYNYHHINGMFAYKVNRRVRPYLKYSFYSYDLVDDSHYNYTIHEILAGVLWRPYDQFEFDWMLGDRRSLTVQKDHSDDGPVLKMRLNYYHSQNIMAYCQASYEFQVGVLSGESYVTSTEAGTMCKISPELAVGGRVVWTRQLNPWDDMRTTEAGMLVRYQFRRQFYFFGEYNWAGQESPAAGGYVNYNKGTIGFKWRY